MSFCPEKISAITMSILIAATVSAFAVSMPQLAYATAPESSESASEPTQKEIDALIAKINEEPVYPSKSQSERSLALPTAQGSYPTGTGQILVTDDKFSGLIPTGHAAIVWDREAVIESLGNGVVWNANNWYQTHGNVWGLEVTSTNMTQDSTAAEWCSLQVGKPYNFNFLDTSRRDAFYCSQLVWAAYYDNFGIDISTSAWGPAIYPMEILDSPNVTKIYQK